MNFGLKYQRKSNRHNDECLGKIWDQNTKGLRRSMSQIESEQNLFFEKQNILAFFPVSSFWDLFMDLPSLPGAKHIWKYLCDFFQRNTDPE